jgi:hypothetical protein
MAEDTRTEIREMLGFVPGFFESLPGPLLDSEWESFKSIELSDQTAIPNKYKELIGIARPAAARLAWPGGRPHVRNRPGAPAVSRPPPAAPAGLLPAHPRPGAPPKSAKPCCGGPPRMPPTPPAPPGHSHHPLNAGRVPNPA